jgi:hypothetical protein
MRVGIDFDNTIVCYDGLFHKIAVAERLVPPNCGPAKTAIRDHLRAAGREHDWTALQGHVYGVGISEARPFWGAIQFLSDPPPGCEVLIISHRTRRPYRGEHLDLHAAARAWLSRHGLGDLLDAGAVHFEETREAKLEKIAATRCDAFVDDLPEFLADPAFPSAVQRILFDPGGIHAPNPLYACCASWDDIAHAFRA